MIAELLAEEIVTMAIKRQNRRLVDEAVDEWNRIGEGEFAQFVSRYVACRWMMIAQRN